MRRTNRPSDAEISEGTKTETKSGGNGEEMEEVAGRFVMMVSPSSGSESGNFEAMSLRLPHCDDGAVQEMLATEGTFGGIVA